MNEEEKKAIDEIRKIRDRQLHTFCDELTILLNLIENQQNECISKQKIKDKIKELRKEVMKYNEELNFKMIENTANRIVVLEEILEEEKNE